MLSGMPTLGGVRLAQIPVGLLPSEMEVREPVEDGHGGSYGEPVSISRVRFVRTAERTAASSAGAQGGYVFADDVRGRIFIDAANSPGAYEVPAGSRISIDGGEPLEVVRVERHDNFDGSCHHWEVEVR